MKSRARRLARKGGSWWSRAQIDERPRNGWRRCFFAGHLRIPVNGFGSFVERSPPQRAKTVGRRLFTTWRRPTKAAPRASRNPPYLPRGGGGGYATYILRADTNRWVSSLPNWLGESRGSRSPLSTPSPSPFPPQDATLRYRDKFPRIARAFSPFSPSFRELRRAAISTRIYMYISLRDEITYIFWRREGIACAGEGRRGSREDSFAPFLFQKKACRGESHGSRGAACPFRV